jgi:predicted permease
MSQTAPASAEASKPGSGIFIALIPWVLFTIIAEHGTLKLASIGALAISIGVCVYSSRGGGRPKMLELAAVATFIAFTIVAFIADPSVTDFLTRYARAIAAGVLAVLVFGSLLFVPFTEEYARESVPRQYWSSPRFKQANRRITALWGGVFTVMVGSHIIAGTINESRTNIIFNWVIPIALVVWGIKHSSPPEEKRVTAEGAST